MGMHCVRAGTGRPLLLLHGLGSSWKSWCPILPALRRERDVIAVDLPGFGDSLPLDGPTSITTLADAVTEFLGEQHLFGVDVAGVDLGGRIALELAGRQVVGRTIAFAPLGFSTNALGSMARVAWVAQHWPAFARAMASNHWTAAALFRSYSARLGQVPRSVLLDELDDYRRARRFWEVLRALQRQKVGRDVVARRIVVGWGRQDRITPPEGFNSLRAIYPAVEIRWLYACGHLPQWDQPEAAVRTIVEATADQL